MPDPIPAATNSDECRVASEAFLNCTTQGQRVVYIAQYLGVSYRQAENIDERFNPRA